MRLDRVSLFSFVFAVAPLTAFAQDASPAGDAAPAGEAQPSAAPAAAAESAFKIKRGFFAESDLGLFLTFGGRNTNDPTLPSRGTSNIQPHVGVTVGYDLVHGPKYSFSLGLRLAMGLNGGAGRVTDAEIAAGDEVTTKSSDYSVIETGLVGAVSFLVTERLAVAVKVDGGGGFVDPDPSTPAVHQPPCLEGETQLDNGDLCSVAGAGGAAFAPTFGAGVGIEYFTLLNDFSVGITLRFQAILLDGMIPAATATFPIKYTF